MNKRELELYIHIPFCARKCSYCDFLSFAAPERVYREYMDKLIEEICGQGPNFQEYRVSTIFVGGGTPSILPADLIMELFATLSENFDIALDAEVTLEANPGTLTMEKLEVYRQSGINRLSIGLQSADDKELKYLGRIHSYDSFLKSYQRARQAGFKNINVDLMSALPGQDVHSWKTTLKKVMMLKPEHISAYSLIIEEGTPFAEKTLELPDEEEERQMYERTGEILQSYGYQQYEISNYAKPGKECQHNLGYWTRREYLGFGVGSASLFQNQRFTNLRDRSAYAAFDGKVESIRRDLETLTVREQMEETMILGLRLIRGVSRSEFQKNFGVSVGEIYGPMLEKYSRMGLLQIKGDRIALTRAGISVSNPIMADFLLDE